MNYQLSIVIPVFNSEQYLPRLFKSLGEVPPEVEIILVNNGSTDNSASLLQHYHETHADTVIIDENRRGVAFARNTGLDNSNGKYVWFIDADDVLLPGAVNRILRVIKGTGFDLLVFDYLSLVEKDKVPKEAPAVKKAEKTKLADILHEMLTILSVDFRITKYLQESLSALNASRIYSMPRIWPFSCLFCCVPITFIGYTMLCMFTTSMQVPLLIRLTPRS